MWSWFYSVTSLAARKQHLQSVLSIHLWRRIPNVPPCRICLPGLPDSPHVKSINCRPATPPYHSTRLARLCDNATISAGLVDPSSSNQAPSILKPTPSPRIVGTFCSHCLFFRLDRKNLPQAFLGTCRSAAVARSNWNIFGRVVGPCTLPFARILEYRFKHRLFFETLKTKVNHVEQTHFCRDSSQGLLNGLRTGILIPPHC